MSSADIGDQEIAAVLRVLRSGRLSQGPALREFEAKLAALAGVTQGVGGSSGTAGLHLALLAVGVADGDEIITIPFSFIAPANVIEYCGARPVCIDIDPVTGNLAAERIPASTASA